jgi:Rad3-related DNA helicase
MAWNLYENDKFLEPLTFSNGKSQEDVVKEVLKSIEEGHKIIFIHGMCGTGKSAIALNIARKLGKSSVVVPGKNLQQQYKKDYEKNKFLKKENGNPLKISVMTGRNNHKCKFLEDNKMAIPKVEVNSKLHDIFAKKRKDVDEISKDVSADNPHIPCKIEIKQKNIERIKGYLRQNPKVNANSFETIKDVKRLSIAPVCPYWSPILMEDYDVDLDHAKKKKYKGLNNLHFNYHERKPGCPYYEQFRAYVDSDVLVFNSLKYLLESIMNRKPETEIEIIDECDEFLDNFSNQKNINIDRLQHALANIPYDESYSKDVSEMIEILKHMKNDSRVQKASESEMIIPLKETGIYDLFQILLNSDKIFEYADEENYIFDAEETARMFKGFFNDSYVIFNKNEDLLRASVVTINLSKRFKDMAEQNKVLVLMSGTLHSKKVLNEIFGIDEFKLIEAETEQPGEIIIKKTGKEMDCKYSNFSNGTCSKEDYFSALNECVENAKKPCVVHVNSFQDLPTEFEINKLGLDNLIPREKLIEIQNEDREGRLVEDFKSGNKEVLFSTRVSRGVDFPGEQCNSIIFTKYPNPNVRDAFWRILNKTNPNYYWDFYKDKAQRELLQKIYRGLRFKEDKVEVLSPDSRVLDFFENQASTN